MIKNMIAIGLGGGAGAILRYVLSEAIRKLTGQTHFPIGILAVNVIGCLAIGLLGGWAHGSGQLANNAKLFLFVGLLGGFTTFSTFSYDTISLVRTGEMLYGLANIGLHMFLGLGAVWIGYAITCTSGT